MLDAKSIFPDFGVRFSRKTAAAKEPWSEKITYYPDDTKVSLRPTILIFSHYTETPHGKEV